MTIQAIENLTFEELKVQKPELLEALKATPHKELAARYLQARTDAKQRDEKLAEQAKTLAALQEGLEAVKEREAKAVVAADELVAGLTNEIDDLRSQTRELEKAKVLDDRTFAATTKDLESKNAVLVKQSEEVLNAARAGFASDKKAWEAEKAELGGQIAELSQRCERLNTQAKSATAAMTTVQVEALNAVSVIQKVVTDVLRNDAIDKANEGE